MQKIYKDGKFSYRATRQESRRVADLVEQQLVEMALETGSPQNGWPSISRAVSAVVSTHYSTFDFDLFYFIVDRYRKRQRYRNRQLRK